MSSEPTYFVTVALPYANGPLHLGHLVEMIEADAWVRNKRLSGQECYFISGDDAHGTPIMIKAQQQGCTPEELVSHIHAQHLDIIRRFHISFDKFSRTDTPANKQRCYDIYERLKKSDLLFEKQHLQAYDKEKQMFLPDRFVKGSCPRCDAADQYGDNCDKCGATYNPQDLKNPYSVLSGTTPEFHSRLHLFTDLKRYQSWLTSYLPSCLSPAVLSKMQEWLRDDLHPWNISRESPYHGIPIPDRPGQYFYVWFDAPIGYLSIFDELFAEKGWGDAVWKRDNLQLVHFIGKDITYFHALFWPVMLKAADLLLPSQIYTHGFLTIEGQKMSKSKGLFVEAQNLAETIPPDLFRYYILSKMNGSIDDFNFDSNELCQKINSDIVGKYLNILSRCSKLLFQYYDGQLSPVDGLSELISRAKNTAVQSHALIDQRQYALAIQSLMKEVDTLNEYLTHQAPWTQLKDEGQAPQAWHTLSETLRAFAVLTQALSPIMPQLISDVQSYFIIDNNDEMPLLQKLDRPYQPLLWRLDPALIKEKLFMTNTDVKDNQPHLPELKKKIGIDDFAKIDLRVGLIKSAEIVSESDKLLKLQVDIGLKIIQVFSGIRGSYNPEELVGQQVVVCVNLEPRKMRFGVSEGMILAASDSNGLSVLTPLQPRQNGALVS